MKKAVLFILLFLSSSWLFSQKEVLIKGEKELIYPFENSQAKLYFVWTENKQDFDSILVLSMGEATHGTKEFFDIKSKSFEYLVTHKDFKVFGIEASYGECNYINDYLQSGIGEIDTVMQYFSFWTWRTEEVKELLQWIEKYNKTTEEKVVFYGFDMQDPYSPLKYNCHLFAGDSSAFIQDYFKITRPVVTKDRYAVRKLLKTNKEFRDSAEIVDKELSLWFKENKSKLNSNYSPYTTSKIKLSIENFRQAIHIYQPPSQYRDSCMALNILAIQKLENSKMFVWAHNGHIKNSYIYKSKKKLRNPMGWFLKDQLVNSYYSVGFVFNQGSFQACTINRLDSNNKKKYTLENVNVGMNKRNTFTTELSKANEKQFFIDISASPNKFFTKKLRSYNIGAVYFGEKMHSYQTIPAKEFDGIIYIETTTVAEKLN